MSTRRGDHTYYSIIRVIRVLFRVLGLRFRIEGSEHIPTEGPGVIVANHLSYLDSMLVGLAARPSDRLIRFMAKQATFDNRISGRLMHRMRHIPVDRASGAAAYRKAVRALAAGELVGVFPEATISRAFTLKTFKLGAATLAVREQVPLVPLVLWAPQRTFTVDKHYSVRRGKTISIKVGEPVSVAADATPAEVDAELRRRMRALLEAALRYYPDTPRDADDQWWVPAELGGGAPTPARADVLEAEYYARKAAKAAAKARN